MIHCDEDSSPEALGPLFKGSKFVQGFVAMHVPTRDKKQQLTFSIGCCADQLLKHNDDCMKITVCS